MKRKIKIMEECCYHVFSKSIEGFRIFLNFHEYTRMIKTVRFYQHERAPMALSEFLSMKRTQRIGFDEMLFQYGAQGEELVRIIAYCLMPTHVHFVLMQNKPDGISKFMGLILNSYTRYFNIKHKRKGPLWQNRFKNVLVDTNEQLHHLIRYVHLNPVTANLVKKAEDWKFSSYPEYIRRNRTGPSICRFEDVLDIDTRTYEKFTEDRADYQKMLKSIQKLALE